MDNTFTDNRGTIKDVIVNQLIDAVTYITFREGAVRGNHIHKKTLQIDFVISGVLLVVTDKKRIVANEGDVVTHYAGTPHAYLALTDASIISMTYGPRKGSSYEKDTFRLKKKLI